MKFISSFFKFSVLFLFFISYSYAVSVAGYTNALTGYYYKNGQLIDIRFDEGMNFHLFPEEKVDVEWEGYLCVETNSNGYYRLLVQHDDGVEIKIDDFITYAYDKWTGDTSQDWKWLYRSTQDQNAPDSAAVYFGNVCKKFNVKYKAGGSPDYIRLVRQKYNDAEQKWGPYEYIPQSSFLTLGASIVTINKFTTEIKPTNEEKTIKIDVSSLLLDSKMLENNQEISISYKTENGSATEGADFEALDGKLVFDKNNNKRFIELKIKARSEDLKESKYFYIKFSETKPSYSVFDKQKGTLLKYEDKILREHNIKITLVGKTSRGGRDFTIRNPIETRNIRGNKLVIGNTVLCPKAYGQCISEPPSNINNARHDLKYINTNNFNEKFKNSSQAVISMPENAKVVWAALYTQGFLHGSDYFSWRDKDLTKFLGDVNLPVHLKFSNNQNINVVPDEIDYIPYSHMMRDIAIILSNNAGTEAYRGHTYSTFSDITKQLKGKTGKDLNGVVSAMGIKAHEGQDFGDEEYWPYDGKMYQVSGSHLGNFGAWVLVLIYEDPNESFKNISVFDGYKAIDNTGGEETKVDIRVDGFLTPLKGEIKSSLSVFAAEGDIANKGDKAFLNGKAIGDPDNAFTSSMSSDIQRNPSLVNNQGIDIHNFQANNHVGHDETSATIELTSVEINGNADAYYASMVVFTTELYMPELCFDYAYYQNNIAFTDEETKKPKHEPNRDTLPFVYSDNVHVGEDINVSFYIKKTDTTRTYFKDVELNILDIDTSQADYAQDSVFVRKSREIYPEHVKDSELKEVSASNVKGIPIPSLGNNEHIYAYYALKPKKEKINLPVNIELKYKLGLPEGYGSDIVGDFRLYLTKDGTKSISLCKPDDGYKPIWAAFNVSDAGIYKKFKTETNTTCSGDECPKFNLPTQVVNKASDFILSSFHEYPTVNDISYIVEGDIPAIVAVDLAQLSGFHVTEANCRQISSVVEGAKRVWIPMFDFEESNKTLSSISLKDALNNFFEDKNNMSKFLGGASENTAFRVIVNLSDSNGTFLKFETQGSKKNQKYKIVNRDEYLTWLLNNTKNDQHKKHSTIEQIKCKKDKNKLVTNVCKSDFMTYDQMVECNECVLGFNNSVICSRDNFSIRPETFYVELNDFDFSDYKKEFEATRISYADYLDTNKDINTKIKKLDSPKQTGNKDINFEKIEQSNISDRLHLAADYEYIYDIKAIGHQDNGEHIGVKGYTGSFQKGPYEHYKQDKSNRYKRMEGLNDKNISIKNIAYYWSVNGAMNGMQDNCNDVNDINFSKKAIFFLNGRSVGNTILKNVGEYHIAIEDSNWTAVDWNKEQMKHKQLAFMKKGNEKDVSAFFVQGKDKSYDCLIDSHEVPENGKISFNSGKLTNLNGCLTSNVEHINKNTKLKYNVNLLRFHPYDINISALENSYWEPERSDFSDANNTSWLYMADMSYGEKGKYKDNAVHFRGDIFPEGKNGSKLSNFVNNCYAETMEMTLDYNNTLNGTSSDLPKNEFLLYSKDELVDEGKNNFDDKNHTIMIKKEKSFHKEDNGTFIGDLNLNFAREANNSINPVDVSYKDIKIIYDKDDSTNLNGLFSIRANLEDDHKVTGEKNYDNNITFFYGRVYERDYKGVSEKELNTTIHYQIYCKDCDNSKYCKNCNASNPKDKINIFDDEYYVYQTYKGEDFYDNNDHNVTSTSSDGHVSHINARHGSHLSRNQENKIINGTEEKVYVKSKSGKDKYIEEIEFTVSPWLLYDINDININHFVYIIEFLGQPGNWLGQGQLGKVVDDTRLPTRVSPRMDW